VPAYGIVNLSADDWFEKLQLSLHSDSVITVKRIALISGVFVGLYLSIHTRNHIVYC